MILINAIYFKGIWKKEFDKNLTEKRKFINFKKEQKLVDFMYKNEYFKYYENENLKTISLDYKDDNMEALIILPKNEYNINNYIKNFNQKTYNEIISGLHMGKVCWYLPKFKIEFSDELTKYFLNLGIKLAFDKILADFSEIKKIGKTRNIFIQQIIHKAYIEIDEKGTETAAVTEIGMFDEEIAIEEEKEEYFIMDIDHPFLFIIRNKKLSSEHDMLFICKIEDLYDEDKNIQKKSESINTNKNRSRSRSRSKKK